MADIQLLDAVTIGQIAAGEVIERPLSVVKELVENAVDAGATRIVVSLERGGIEQVEVSDDGVGIAADQLALAVRRHATSKLRHAHELTQIGSLGFRGEGLASIAAVARVELISRTRTSQIGARVESHAEETGAIEPAASPLGTTVRARALFENVPVRRDYLRSPSAEFNRISGWLTQFALAYPRIAFVLRHDGKEVWTLPPSDDSRARLTAVFGKAASESMIALDGAATTSLTGQLRGFISTPGNDRADRRMQILFVNGRLLRTSLLAGAWTSGYATFTMVGRHPYGVLFLDVPADHVDPNVHPTKSEVRLRFAEQAFDTTRRAISATLRAQARQRLGDAISVSLAPAAMDELAPRIQALFEMPASAPAANGAPSSSGLRVLAQLNRTFVLATDGSALVLVDQHAAHERIAYEAILEGARKPAPSEPLLVAQIVELDAARSAVLDTAIPSLRDGGLEIEAFGERTYRITATPAGYRARGFDVDGFLDDLIEDGKQRNVEERVWASLACHSVTVAGETLESAEMTALIDRLLLCENPMHCPHGRPTIVRLSPDDVARMFKRM